MGTSADQEKDQFRSQAKRHASQRSLPTLADSNPTFPSSASHTTRRTTLHQAGGLNTHNGRGRAPDATHGDHDDEKSAHLHTLPSSSSTDSPPAASAVKSEDAGPGDSTIESGETVKQKNPMTIARMKAGSVRFVGHFKRAICHSWINVLLVAVPAGIAAEAAHLKPAVVFAINAVAIVPLAGLLSQATESVATRLGDTWGALLNVSFGNAVELIIFIIALVKNEIRIVQASLLGSILANLLLILGMAFLLGGLRFREQIYNSTVTQMSACLLSLSVMSLLLPVSMLLSSFATRTDKTRRPHSTPLSMRLVPTARTTRSSKSVAAPVSYCSSSTSSTCSSNSRATHTCMRACHKRKSTRSPILVSSTT